MEEGVRGSVPGLHGGLVRVAEEEDAAMLRSIEERLQHACSGSRLQADPELSRKDP
ncbi:hypothetical protein DPMN_097031 [Dreissena polymorpha]|uniref:Uncharacterized protein n=1 Tax=Dreissena polymorpha TaxID=45954 RepID=A0A9D4R518_DREPO|nr:hypothetical protein DPMN_097031 [Dreissena polymorpha]